jgi:hypothetical protein
MNAWQNLPAGPQLRQIIAERLGWHMRKIPVGSNGIAYDYLIYNNDDHLMYQREIAANDLTDEAAHIAQTWLAAMNDPDCPRWDEDIQEAHDLAYGRAYAVQPTPDGFTAWVQSPDYTGTGTTKALALARAWLASTDA